MNREVPAHALQQMADGLPAGTCRGAGRDQGAGRRDQPPAILGDLISKAMVGTFSGFCWRMASWGRWLRGLSAATMKP